MATKKAHPYRKAIIWLTVLVCLIEAFTKGWMALILLPVSVVVLPVYVVVQYAALRHADKPQGNRVTLAAVSLTILMLLAYVCTPGADDTDQSLLFGFYSALDTSLIARLSGVVSIVSYCLAVATFFVLVWLLVANRKRR